MAMQISLSKLQRLHFALSIVFFVLVSCFLFVQKVNAEDFSVTTPSNKTTYSIGDKIKIRWDSDNFESRTKVKLRLASDEGAGIYSDVAYIGTIKANAGAYTYKISKDKDRCVNLEPATVECKSITQWAISDGKTKFAIVAESWNGNKILGRSTSDSFVIKDKNKRNSSSNVEPTLKFSASPTFIKAGESINFRWDSKNTKKCEMRISNGLEEEFIDIIPLVGTEEFELSETTDVTIKCESASRGSVSKSVTITVAK